MSSLYDTPQLIVYLVVLLVSLGWFGLTVYKRLRVLGYARSYDARGNVDRRIGGVFKHVFGQWRLLHGDIAAGLMHFFIFWGFLVVLLNTFHFLIQGPVAQFDLPLLARDAWLGRGYLVLRDLFELLVLIAVFYAGWRRLVTKPKRLELSGEAVLILGLIAILMVADFLMGGADRAMSTVVGQWHSPAETIVGAALNGLSGSALLIIRTVCWWVHLVSLLYFLNLLPLGKHFHVLLSLFGVYLRNLRPAGELSKVDFEDEEAEEYGASQLRHLTWKNFLDAYDCTECGRCDHFCPANQTGKDLSPRQIVIGTRDRLYASQPAILKALSVGSDGSEGDTAAVEDGPPAFVGEVHTDRALWACTTCGACDTHCPLFIEHVEPIVEMRRHLVLEEEGRFPKELVATFNGLERQGNPWAIGAHERMGWAEGLEVPTLSDNPDAEYVYFVGCMASFDERNKATALALVELLRHAGVSFAVLDAETCCGDPARRTGNEYLAQALIEVNAEQLKEGGVKKVVTACPHCFNTLKREYGAFGVEFEEVLHHGTLLARLINAGKLDPQREREAQRIVFHDSCYLGRYNSIYYQPRDVLRSIRGLQLAEAASSRDKGYCCGAGGGMMFMEETEGQRVNHWRYEQLTASGASGIAVACPFCLVMLDDAAKDLAADGALPVEDIAVTLSRAVLGQLDA